MLWLTIALLGCGNKNTLPPQSSSSGDTGEPPTTAAGLVSIDGGTFPLGETRGTVIARFDGIPDGEEGETETQTIIPQASFTLEPYAIERYPFPGVPDVPWYTDGLTHTLVSALDSRLAPFGRRVCTIAELLFAAAGPDNHAYPYGDGSHDPNACDDDDFNPDLIGSHPDCVSDLGIRDFQVRSTWGTLDDRTVAIMGETVQAEGFPGDLFYAVWGGTSRSDTLYAPNNFGFHTHGADAEDVYQDDGFRVCAGPTMPTDEQDLAYEWWIEEAVAAGSYTVLFE